jgi:hypothetical protein
MKESETPSQREDKAVQALISAALHVPDKDVTMEEIQSYLSGEIILSSEDEAALERKGVPTPALVEASTAAIEKTAEAEAFMALHRKQPEKGFSTKTEEEVRRKREELLEKLRKKKGAG